MVFFQKTDTVLGILAEEEAASDDDAVAQDLAEQRVQARKDKNWALADELRDKMAAMGYVVEDTPAGPRIKKQ